MIYELHIGTFTREGTLDSAIDKLDYLVDLGVDFVELMPVNAFAGTHGWGYDGVLWYAVHEPYGGPDALVRFVDACHARGLGVLIDAVFNHLGPSGNYLPRFGPYLSSGSNPWGEGINIADAGLRRGTPLHHRLRAALDARLPRRRAAAGRRARAVDTTAIHILEELSAETDALAQQLGRPLSLIAESDLNDPRLITPRDRGGYGMTAQWDDDIHHAIHTAVSGERQGYYADFGSLATLATTLQNGYFHAGTYSSFRQPAPRTAAGQVHHPRDPTDGLHLYPRPGRQPRRRRPPVAEPRLRPARGQGRAGARISLHRNAFHGRGMGFFSPFQFFSSPSRTRAGAAHRRGTQGRVRRARLGRRRSTRSAGSGDVPAVQARLG